jgi:hypothetical protein
MTNTDRSAGRYGWPCIAALFGFTALVGCATTTSQVQSFEDGCSKTHEGSAASNEPCLIRITPLSSLTTGFSDPDQNFSNLYTRVLVLGRGTQGRDALTTDEVPTAARSESSEPSAHAQRSEIYEYRDRGPLLRALWGTHYSINLTAYVTVGTYQATIPLVTIDHASTRTDGEKFLRVVAHSVQNFPLLLIKGDGSNAVATVKFVVKASDESQSRVAALAIQAAEAVAKAISPESAVVTTLNTQNARDKANALDAAINSLMAKQLDEEQLIDNDVRRWSNGALVTFRIPPPAHESTWDSDFSTVGAWRVQFENPRPSVFSDVQLCYGHVRGDALWAPTDRRYCRSDVAAAIDAAQKEAATRPEQVIAFNLVNASQSLGSVGAFLKQQAWWDTSMKAFNGLKKGDVPPPDDISGFCRSIKDTIATVGLNAVDAGIVVAAVRDRSQLSASVVTAMRATEDCGYARAGP